MICISHLTRRFRRTIAQALLAALLFAQAMHAAHACPEMGLANAARGTAASAPHDASGVESMRDDTDAASSALCAEHCRGGAQSPDHGQVDVPAPALVALYGEVSRAFEPMPHPALARVFDAPAPAAPPHTLLHCCLRV